MSEHVTARPPRGRKERRELPSLPPSAAAPLSGAMLALVLLFLAQQFGVAITSIVPSALVVLGAAVAAAGAVQFASRRGGS